MSWQADVGAIHERAKRSGVNIDAFEQGYVEDDCWYTDDNVVELLSDLMDAIEISNLPDWFCDIWFKANEGRYVPNYRDADSTILRGTSRARLVSPEGMKAIQEDWKAGYIRLQQMVIEGRT